MSKIKSILIVDDEQPIREMIGFTLSRNGFTYSEATDAKQAFTQIEQQLPDLILLDWMLPGTSGIDIAKRLKQQPRTQQIPIIMLTARAEEDSKVRGLEVGADDYMIKPFSPRELIARINAVLRRTYLEKDQTEIITIAELHIDHANRQITAKNQPLKLSPLEYRLLFFLATHADRIYSREQLLDHVWGETHFIDNRTVDVQIRRIRRALALAGLGQLIQTVRGAGYRFSSKYSA